MSASREKRQRHGQEASTTPSQQQSKKGVYTAIAVVCVLLVAALLVWNAIDLSSSKNTVVATVGDTDYTTTELGYYYYQTANIYTQYGLTLDDDTKTYIREQALDSLHLYAALAAEAEANGFALSEESIADIDTYILQMQAYAAQSSTTLATYIKSYYGSNMTEDVLRACMIRDQLATEYYNLYADLLDIDDSQLAAYYSENGYNLDSYTYSALFINGAPATATDADGNTIEATDAEIATATTLAQLTSEEFLSGLEDSDFDSLAAEIALRDSGSSATATTTTLGSSLSSTYKDWLIDEGRVAGEVTTIEVEGSGIWVIQFVDRYLDETSYGDVDIRHILVLAELEEDATAPTDEAMDAAQAEAQSILDQFLAGDQTADSFGALAELYSDDPGSNTNGGQYTEITPDTSFFDGFMEWIFATGRQVGDTGLVENPQEGQYGWHVLYMEAQRDLVWETTATTAIESELMTAWTEELQTTYALTSDEAALALVG